MILILQITSGYYYMFLTAYKDAIEDLTLTLIFELVFLCDFVLQFFLTFSNSGNSYQQADFIVESPTLIREHYLNSREFKMDLLCLIPF